MAINVQNYVWSLDLPPHLKYVAIALADHARPDGSNARPSQQTLAEKTGLTDRSVRRALHELCERGVIAKVKKGRTGSATNYSFLNVPDAPEGRTPTSYPPAQGRTPTSGRVGRPRPVRSDAHVLLTIKNLKEPSGGESESGVGSAGEEPSVVDNDARSRLLYEARNALGRTTGDSTLA